MGCCRSRDWLPIQARSVVNLWVLVLYLGESLRGVWLRPGYENSTQIPTVGIRKQPRGPRDWKNSISRGNIEKIKLSIRNEIFNRDGFFIPGPSLTAEKQGPGLKFSIENEKFQTENGTFQARMKISCVGEWFFHAFERELIFSISGPSARDSEGKDSEGKDNPHWESPRPREPKARDSEVRDSKDRDFEDRDSRNGQTQGPLYSDTPWAPSDVLMMFEARIPFLFKDFRSSSGKEKLGACVTTTKYLDNKILSFTILLSWRFPWKIAFWTIFLPAPLPTPPEKRKFYFYCRLAFSESSGKEKSVFFCLPWILVLVKSQTRCGIRPAFPDGASPSMEPIRRSWL